MSAAPAANTRVKNSVCRRNVVMEPFDAVCCPMSRLVEVWYQLETWSTVWRRVYVFDGGVWSHLQGI